jgi:hypothetical protein
MRLSPRTIAPTVLLAVVALGAWACSGLLGINEHLFLDDGDGAPPLPPPDAASDVAQPSDSGASDAAPEADATGDAMDCGDLATSPTNCGRCGHDCLGGACDGGACEPVGIAQGISPRDIVLDATHVYYIVPNDATVVQMDKDGSHRVELAVGGAGNSFVIGLAVDDTSVYWGSLEGNLFRCKIGGCSLPTPLQNSAVSALNGVAVDATNLFWIDVDTNRIRFVPKNGVSSTVPPKTLADAGGVPARIAYNDGFTYWTTDDGKVRRAAADGGATAVVGQSVGAALGIAVDQSTVYWTAGDDPGTVNRAPKGGPPPGSALATGQHLPIGVAVDDKAVYWVNAGAGVGGDDGTVMMCAFASCNNPTVLASHQKSPVAIAVDDKAVYFSDYAGGNDDGALMRLAKP